MSDNPAKTKELLSMIVVLCTAVALIVLAIDMQIKRDLLRIGNRAHDDLLEIRRLNEQDQRLSRRSDLPVAADGDSSGIDVDHADAEVETSAADAPAHEPVHSSQAGRAEQVIRRRSARSPRVPATDK